MKQLLEIIEETRASRDRLQRELDAVKAKLEASERDTERLDWLDKQKCCFDYPLKAREWTSMWTSYDRDCCTVNPLRTAIDEARKKGKR